MFFKGWQTHVHCDGDIVEEYDFRIVDDATVSCYIPSEAGKNFAVKWRNDLGMPASAQCYMDGRYMGNSTVESGSSGARNGIRTDACYKQYFQFASLDTTDDDDVADPDDPSINNIGVIEVRVYRIRFSHKPYRPNPPHRPREVAERALVHERSKKAGSHCVRLDAGRQCQPAGGGPPGPRRLYIDNVQRPYIRFIFRYQPRAMLEANGIIPRDGPSGQRARHPDYHAPQQVKAEPGPLAERLGSEYYDDMRVEEMLRPQRSQQQPRRDAYVYAHPRDAAPPLAPAPPRSRPFVIDVDADVIDLTQDDDD